MSRTTVPPRRRGRSFRLGTAEPSSRGAWRQVVPVVLAFVIGALLFGGGGYLVGKPSEQQQQVQDLQRADAARDVKQIGELTTLARTTRDQLVPVLTGLVAALPVDPATAPKPATAAEVARWQQTVDAATKPFDDPPSGATATNVARGSLTAAVDQVAVAVRTYALSLTVPAATAGQLRALAAKERDTAVTTWSVGGTQLDQINIDAGNGHQHVFLPADPGSGAFTADGAPEGSGHR